jgi:signal transduction histidine kinase
MLNRVIEVSAIMTDNFALYVQDFDLIDLIESLIDEHMTRIEAAGITLIPMFRTNRLAMQGDVERLSTAFAAVLENAYHYTLEGGQIRLVVRHEPDCAVVEISDTGVGIPFDEQDKVFERLYRGSAADAGLTDSRGMGLGLYVTRHYVQAHKGNIVLTSEPGVGTTVTISLPLVQEGEI